MAPLTAAERSKRYREENKAKLLEWHAWRKRIKRVDMKITNPEKIKAILLKELLYKRDYKKRMKKNNLDQLVPSISESTEDGFSQWSTHSRSMRKAEGVLHKSPRRRNVVLSEDGQKFLVD